MLQDMSLASLLPVALQWARAAALELEELQPWTILHGLMVTLAVAV